MDRGLMSSWRVAVGIAAASAGVACLAETPFATRVVEFTPAPGQFVNTPEFNDPAKALGPPQGGGTIQPDNSSVVSLGGFGGSLTLGFDHTVTDDPLNPFGMDAIVFGNAHWVGGNRDRRWAECATIEISLDVNGNGLADDPWYLIPGSHLVGPLSRTVMTWDDNVGDSTYPPSSASWIPPGRSGTWTTSAFALPDSPFGAVVVVNPAAGTGSEGIFGYADSSPTLVLGDRNGDNVVDDAAMTAEEFYTVPDDSLTSGVTPGSGGGDAFDIAWAIDPATGEPAHLPGFDFIRITTAVHSVNAPFGEKSAEIDAVADVSPDRHGDADGDGDIDLFDLAVVQECFGDETANGAECEALDRASDGLVDWSDVTHVLRRITGPRWLTERTAQ